MSKPAGGKDGTHARWRSYQTRRVTFVLAELDHKLVLVPVQMRIRIREALYDRNVFEGDIQEAWLRLSPLHKAMEFVGVLHADHQREFLGAIGWVEETTPKMKGTTPARAVVMT